MKINNFYPLGHDEYLSLRSQLKPNELLLYLYLVTKHPFQDSKVEIDTALISEQLGYHRRTVQLAIKKLVSLRLLPDWFEIETYENPEHQVVQRLQAKLGGQTEVVTAIGRIDLLTETEIIEVKQVSDWKAALGQILTYAGFFPEHTKRIHLFGDCTPQKKEVICSTLLSFDVIATFEGGKNE
jgi:hypothetical protein